MDITDFLGQHTGKHIDILLDSSSAITLCTTLRTYHRTKHINLRINYIREMINSGILVLHFIPTDQNVADALTKPLPESLYSQHRNILLNGHGGLNPISQQYEQLNYTNFNEME